MKRYLLVTLLALSGCGQDSVTAPSPLPASQTTVSVLSQKTGQTTLVPLAATDPQPPSCAWRDKVIELHISLGGSKNDIVKLANQHEVFIQDTGAGYRLVDYPSPWCTADAIRLEGRVTKLVSCGGWLITPDTFASAPHPDPGSSCWSLDGVTKRRF